MSKLLNPFEILLEYQRPTYSPSSRPRVDASNPLSTVMYPGECSPGPLVVIQGAAGVGKTHRLMGDMGLMNGIRGRLDYCEVTSLNNATVDEVNDRVCEEAHSAVKGASLDEATPEEANGRTREEMQRGVERVETHRTLHKTIYHWLGKQVGGQVAARRTRPAQYLKEPFNDELLSQYVADAEYKDEEKRALKGAFKAWDATREPLPEFLANPAALPPECAYDWTLYKVCLEMERKFAAGELLLPSKTMPFRGALLIDEAQDLSPLHALALGWYALDHHLQVRCYGDPNQMMDQDRPMPFLWEQGGKLEYFFGADPSRRRVPMAIGRLCEMVLPGRVPPAEEWCNLESEAKGVGRVIPVSTPTKRELIEVSKGFSIHESRYRVKSGFKFVAPGVAVGPTVGSVQKLKKQGLPHAVISTAFMTKGREHELVTIQRWLPKHQDEYLAGSVQARNRLYVALTRTTDIAIIHTEMYDMILRGRYHKWN